MNKICEALAWMAKGIIPAAQLTFALYMLAFTVAVFWTVVTCKKKACKMDVPYLGIHVTMEKNQ